MGLSWREIRNGLEDQTILPPAHARHLLAELEARPFTRAMLFGEERSHDLDDLTTFMADVLGKPPDLPPIEAAYSDEEIELACREYEQRRQELMALLRAAIERNEPLRIDA
jgi:hypothetical protein